MKVKELIKLLKTMDQDKNICVSSDEELNTIYSKFDIHLVVDHKNNPKYYCIFGFSGSEIE